MTSFLEQIIEYVVGPIIPRLRQSLLRNFQPSSTLGVGFNRNKNLGFIRQRQSLPENQFTVLVKSFDRRSHGLRLTLWAACHKLGRAQLGPQP
jgi:hypothetical protein